MNVAVALFGRSMEPIRDSPIMSFLAETQSVQNWRWYIVSGSTKNDRQNVDDQWRQWIGINSGLGKCRVLILFDVLHIFELDFNYFWYSLNLHSFKIVNLIYTCWVRTWLLFVQLETQLVHFVLIRTWFIHVLIFELDLNSFLFSVIHIFFFNKLD